MSRAAHLAELERRHRALEAELVEARAHRSIDDLQIVELKRRKLLVKDEIAHLQTLIGMRGRRREQFSDYRSPCIRRLALTARSLSRCYGCGPEWRSARSGRQADR
jgi:hypothetical protein